MSFNLETNIGNSSGEESGDLWWSSEVFENTLKKQKKTRIVDKSNKNINKSDNPTCLSPTITITYDENDIEVARIESYFERNLTPEGNVKYKNYKVLKPSNIPIRMYSPSGDINTSPKKGKIMPKYDHFTDFTSHREKLLKLITEETPCNDLLFQIIKPAEHHRRAVDILRKSNVSSLDDYINFLNSATYSPSPSHSVYSDDAHSECDFSPSSSPEMDEKIKKIFKSQSIDENKIPKKNIIRQASMPNDDFLYEMNLSDELHNAERLQLRSYTPKSMLNVSNSYYRPNSSTFYYGKRSPFLESKKSILRSFIQKNMISQPKYRDKLGKMALAIEDDDEDEDLCSFITSGRILENRVAIMMEEIRELRENLMDVQEDLKESEKHVLHLLTQSKNYFVELEVLRYLDDLILLLNGQLNVIGFKNWPFILYGRKDRDKANINLII